MTAPHIATCPDCNASFTTRSTSPRTRCPACRPLNKKRLNAERWLRLRLVILEQNKRIPGDRREERRNNEIRIIEGDKETMLDFDRRHFPMLELQYMAKDASLPEGTVLCRLVTNTVYLVKAKKLARVGIRV